MQYAPGIAEFIDRSNAILVPDFYTYPIPEQRHLYERLIDEFHYERPKSVEVWNDSVYHEGRTIPLRIYQRKDHYNKGALLFMHGGGFVIGSLATHDTFVAEMADKTGLTMIAVQFRPAPEHPFPAAPEDCYSALCGVVEAAERLDIDPTRIGVCGDSSGANLATILCLMTRDRQGPPIKAQVLISPVLDFARWKSGGEDAPLLSAGEMAFFTKCYVGDMANIEHPYISPLRSAQFHALPEAYIMAAELDSLCVDAVQYTELLRQNNTPVELVIEPGLVHACIRARGISKGTAEAVDRVCNAARRLLANGDVKK